MGAKLRWGILSTARINRALLGPLQESARSELVAVASRNLERAQDYAREKSIPKAYGSYEALLADSDIDVIYNPLPNALHAEWTVKAAEAGKHVLCEKPLVTTMAELDQVEAAATANNVTIFEAFMYLYHPQMEQIFELVHSGRLGQLQMINSWFAYYLPPENTANVRLHPDLAGGSMWDVGVYPNSLAIYMAQAGAPEAVWASQRRDQNGVDVDMQAQMRFSNGVTAQIACGFRTPFRVGAQIVGEKGYLNIERPWGRWEKQRQHVYLFTGDDEGELIETPVANPYLAEVQAMEACVFEGATPLVPLSLSREFLRSVVAIYQAAETDDVIYL